MLIYPVIAIVSASGLILQISLTRIFAVGQWYHYAFLSVSLAFLGYGASGSLMTLWRERLGRVPLRETLSVAASASGLMAFLGYLAVNLIPFDPFRIVLEPVQLVYLAIQYVTLSLAFLVSGFVIGWSVSTMPARGGALYGASMVGSGIGALVSPWCLSIAGEPGAVLIVTVLGGVAGLLAAVGGLQSGQGKTGANTARSEAHGAGTAGSEGTRPQDAGPMPVRSEKAGPGATGPAVGEPGAAGPEECRPETAQPQRVGPAAAGLDATRPAAGEPETVGPAVGEPEAARPETSRSEATRRRRWAGSMFPLLLSVAVLVSGIAFLITGPAFLDIRLSEYKGLSQVMRFPDAQIEYESVSSHSRVTAVSTSLIHEAPGLSYLFAGRIPKQVGLFVDGESVTPVTIAGAPDSEFATRLLTAVGAVVGRPASALVVNPKGGMDLLTLRALAVTDVTAVESDPLVAKAVWSVIEGTPAESVFAGVDLHTTQPRSFLSWTDRRFDLVQISLSDSFSAVTAGMYSLHEDYLYTVEGIAACLDRLTEDGILQVTRWIQIPPSESVRLWSTVLEAIQSRGGLDSWSLAAVRTWRMLTVLVKRGEFRSIEIARLKQFTSENAFDLVYYKGMSRDEANRYNRLSEPIYHDLFTRMLTNERDEILSGCEYDIRPSTDDRPFFFHFFRWAQVPAMVANIGRQWQPFGGGGFLVVLAYLVVAIIASLTFILLPIRALRQHAPSQKWQGRWPSLAYFVLLGLAFQFVEVPLMQKFILFLDHPTQAFSIVLGGMLVFTGIGSSLSSRVRAGRSGLVVATASLVVIVYPGLLTSLIRSFLDASITVRCAVSLTCMAPLALMGMPFPLGIRSVSRSNLAAVPWAFAANGSAAVIASILSALVSLSLGFSAVLLAGGLAYALAALLIYRLDRPTG